jgi:hypothetical protein
VIHRLARIHPTPSRSESVARIVSPETRLLVSPFSKETYAAICKVHRQLSNPNSLGEQWSISRKRPALSSSKISRVLLGRKDLASSGSPKQGPRGGLSRVIRRSAVSFRKERINHVDS